MQKSIGMSSRGDNEEKLLLIEDLLHSEQHLAEEIEKRPENASRLLDELDEVRKTRQMAVKEFGGGNINSKSWCRTKHFGMAHLRSQELLNNAARIDRDQGGSIAILANRIRNHRDNAVNDFLSGSEGGSGCKRCAGDLSIEEDVFSDMKGVSRVKRTKSVSSDNSAVYFILLALGVGVALFAFSQLKK